MTVGCAAYRVFKWTDLARDVQSEACGSDCLRRCDPVDRVFLSLDVKSVRHTDLRLGSR